MSNAPSKTPLMVARHHAENLKAFLAPFCDQIEIAGSIRREKPEVSDIEIVCIPSTQLVGLFGTERQRHEGFVRAVTALPRIKGSAMDGKYLQRTDPVSGMNVDIFMVQPDTWGMQLAIRTGSADFNQAVILRRLARYGYKMDGGHIWYRSETTPTPTPTEEELFRLIGMDWVHPRDRVVEKPLEMPQNRAKWIS